MKKFSFNIFIINLLICSPTKNSEQPVPYKLKNFKKTQGIKSELLDPNHSHFLLVDNAHQNVTI
jgi:hypothetical protein